MSTVKLICTYQIMAAHRLYRPDWNEEKNKEIFGKCANIHGHQYTMELQLIGKPCDETGMLINGYDVDEIVGPFIREQFDHKFLNQDVAFFQDKQPTAENIAVWVYRELKDIFPERAKLLRVRIYETPELAVEFPVEDQ